MALEVPGSYIGNVNQLRRSSARGGESSSNLNPQDQVSISSGNDSSIKANGSSAKKGNVGTTFEDKIAERFGALTDEEAVILDELRQLHSERSIYIPFLSILEKSSSKSDFFGCMEKLVELLDEENLQIPTEERDTPEVGPKNFSTRGIGPHLGGCLLSLSMGSKDIKQFQELTESMIKLLKESPHLLSIEFGNFHNIVGVLADRSPDELQAALQGIDHFLETNPNFLRSSTMIFRLVDHFAQKTDSTEALLGHLDGLSEFYSLVKGTAAELGLADDGFQETYIGPARHPLVILERFPMLLQEEGLWEISQMSIEEQTAYLDNAIEAFEAYGEIGGFRLNFIKNPQIQDLINHPGLEHAILTRDVSDLVMRDTFVNYARERNPNMPLGVFLSLCVALKGRLLEISEMPQTISDADVIMEFDTMMAHRSAALGRTVYGPEVRTLLFCHEVETNSLGDHLFSDFNALMDNSGSDTLVSLSGPSREEIQAGLGEVYASADGRPTTITISGHGSPTHISMGEASIGFQDVADAIAKHPDPSSITIVLYCCHARAFGGNLIRYLQETYPEIKLPTVIGLGANGDSLGSISGEVEGAMAELALSAGRQSVTIGKVSDQFERNDIFFNSWFHQWDQNFHQELLLPSNFDFWILHPLPSGDGVVEVSELDQATQRKINFHA